MPDHPRATASLAGQPLRPLLEAFPAVCFTGALVNDIAYADTADMQWANFSVWLLTAGLVMGGLTVLAALIDFFGDARLRTIPATVLHGIGLVTAMVVALVNAFVHSRDGWTSVVPTGLVLSIVTVLLMALTGWAGRSLIYRHRLGVA
ncbi:DUF2231 domain-containing protein [Sphingomonas bacterium]|uniref:DUF2231 domain-containing protein n=1 Tax=Sphingomonas bacterium TaxID=1895847 RepID=UPI0015760356|nr:DUF2231 domain-containing protein [Sphingomonas bacterium]